MSTATCTADCHETRSPDREANGRFAKGNKGGPGNPFGRKLAANRVAALEAEGPEKIKDVMHALYNKACGGDVAAARAYLEYTVGKPLPAKEPDLIDVDEFEVAKAKRIPYPDAMIALLDLPVEKATEMAGQSPPTTGSGVDYDDEVEEDEAPAPVSTPETKAAAYKFLFEFMATGEIPADSPFAPLPDGTDPELVKEHERLIGYFVKGLKGEFPDGSPFRPLGDGGRIAPRRRKEREGAADNAVCDGAGGMNEAVCAVG